MSQNLYFASGHSAYYPDPSIGLSRFGTTPSTIGNVLREAYTYAGLDATAFACGAYLSTVTHMVSARLRGALEGFDRPEGEQVPRVYSRERNLSLIVAAGNEYVGFAGSSSSVSTRSRKSLTLLPSADQLSSQLEFDLGIEGINLPKTQNDNEHREEVWYFMHRLHGGVVHSEISLASSMTPSKFPSGWKVRIILPPLTLTPVIMSELMAA